MHSAKVELDERTLVNQLTAMFDAPAYIRRARDVERAYEELIERCKRQRLAWLAGVRWHLTRLFATLLAEDVVPHLDDMMERVAVVIRESGWQPRQARTASRSRVGRAILKDLRGSIARFNRRWSAYWQQLDFSEVNRLRDGYNRYYLLEKECAVGSERLAISTFRRLQPVTIDELKARFPLLPMP